MVSILGYQILEQLYNGLRTLVYRGIREADEKPVVIKILKNSLPDFSELVQFRNQYTIASRFNYPGIIQTYSLENYQNSYALVMEDIQGVSLREYMLGGNIASLEDVLSITVQITDTLYHIHQNRVIHKDIKPDNILINPQTKEIKLIDFSIASLLPKESQEIKNPNVLEGTLAYLSPEQTGRMNRGVDYRTDFYSLGVTLFELLTGELPFKSDDAVELVHCHIAKAPPSMNKFHLNPLLINKPHSNPLLGNKPHPNPLLGKEREHEREQEIPEVISNIVMKLMAKNAEDRYQSALGLKYDLEVCLQQIQETGIIENFQIAQRDICDRFLIPEKLYGRENEVEQLLAAFNRVSNGNRELMLVAGFSGIGKTAVINEVHKPIVKGRGYFLKGKFDQFNRNIPLDAFVQAFRDLMAQLLSESDAQLSSWKNKILQALGDNAQVIIDVIPELEQIIDKQPPAAELSATAAQNRFNLLFQKFIQVFTTKEHPLVVFLDDLQWADLASLKLIELLMSNSTEYLLIIGAYRDNEVFPAHPLILTLEEITKSKAIVNTITLTPLKQESLNQLVADTLSCTYLTAKPLTQLVYQKTQGNPFFSTQFLKVLYEDSLIKFNPPHSSLSKEGSQGGWICDISEVKALALSNDVVEFMALQLQKLPEETQDILKLAACIGNQFDLKTLAIVSQNSEYQTALYLWKALQSGLILPQSEVYKFYLESETNTRLFPEKIVNYKFLHDRVQQAAYSLIPDNQKQKTHYHIGQLLLQQTSPEAIEECIFELVNQLNYGITLITEEKQRTQLAKLNLIATRKARSAIAYQAARDYASIGLSLLGENAWLWEYEISLAFHDLAAELASLCGNFEEMEEFVDAVIAKANSLLEKVYVYRIRIQANISQNKLSEAISIGKQILQQLGITFPDTPTGEDIQNSIAEIGSMIGDREIEDLVFLPIMTEAEKIAIIEIVNSVMMGAFICGSTLYPLLVALSVKLSIQYGNTEASAHAYVAYAVSACINQDVGAGVKFGHLALELVAKLNAKTVKSQVISAFGSFILHRKSHLKETLPLHKEGYATALEFGILEYAGHNACQLCFNSFFSAQPLVTLEQETKAYCNVLVQLNQLTVANYASLTWQASLNLLGFVEHPTILSGEAFQETELIPLLKEARDFCGLSTFYLYKLMLSFIFGEIESAIEHAEELKRYLTGLNGTVCEPTFYFYDSLVILAALTQSEDRSELFERVEENQMQLQQYWAKYAPMNHQHKVDLVAAEKCRILGKKAEAIELYDKAISGAKENEYIQEVALSNELAAKFYLDWGKEKVASSYMQDAYYCYARWGAKAKTDDLEKCYPHLLAPILQTQRQGIGLSQTHSSSINKFYPLNQTIQTSSSSSSISETLDFASILKASQALSSEIQLSQLISKLIQVVIENAGALKGALMLFESNHLMLKAVATTSDIKLLNLPYENSSEIPNAVINHVKRTQKIIVLDNATQNSDFIADSYLIQQQPKSLLCMPILNQGKIIGLLYLENNLTIGAFTQHRVEILNLLCSQAAISLENSQLYHTLEEKVEQRTQEVRQTLKELQQTQAQLIQNEKMSSLGQLVAGIAHEINNPISFIYGNLKPASEYTLDLIELINLYQKIYPQSLPEIESKIEEIELDFLIEDLPKLLDSMQTGAVRIREIVISLRNFSRLDEAELKPVDIHSGIDSTLLILQQKLNSNDKYPEIEVIKNYNKLPKINCYASELNQVFLNIISNAIDALRSQQQNQPKITISTSFKDDNNILISIKDNGIGISESVLNKIFDPFFTTKPVGSGTGLGLSTSYSIVVEKHQGNLSCVSTPGEATEFLIELPIK